MEADATAPSKQWLTVDANDADLSVCENGLICWSHLGGDGDLTTLMDTESASTEATDFSQRQPAKDRLKGQESLFASANELLAYVVHGMANNVPVVMAAPLRDFDAAGPMGSLLTIVEGLVPRQWSKNLYIRGFTRNPALFLDKLHCNLIAVPSDVAEQVFEVRRDVILLDQEARAVERHDLLAAARIYADRTFELVSGNREMIDAVLDRVARVAPAPADLPPDLVAVFELAFLLSEGSDIAELHSCEVLKKHPSLLVDAMLASGQWQDWRNRSQDSAEFLRQAAIEWCASTFWRTHECRLEDWVQIVRDLGEVVLPADLERMMDRQVRAVPFPPIAWFEQEQQADIERLQRDNAKS